MWQRHLIDVMVDQLKAIQMVPLQLPNLFDPRALRVAAMLLAVNVVSGFGFRFMYPHFHRRVSPCHQWPTFLLRP